MKDAQRETGIPFSAGAVLISVGVVYGDIGTSPMYVMKSIIEGNGGITGTGEVVIYGALSLVIWTIILLTTVKYVLIAMQADNHNEGGIFALYSLVKKCGKWLVFPAMIGGAALLADGILTPAVTVTTAIEGLRSIPWVYKVLGNDQDKIVVITPCDHRCPFSDAEGRYQLHRKGLRSGYDPVVSLSGSSRMLSYYGGPGNPPGIESSVGCENTGKPG